MADMHQIPDGVSKQIAEKLAELQGDRTDAEMAALLGVGRVHWHHIKNGRRAPSYAMVKRAAVAFPAIGLIVVHDLSAPAERAS